MMMLCMQVTKQYTNFTGLVLYCCQRWADGKGYVVRMSEKLASTSRFAWQSRAPTCCSSRCRTLSSTSTANSPCPALSEAKPLPPDHSGSISSLSPLPARRMSDYKRRYPSRLVWRRRMDLRRAEMGLCSCLRSALLMLRLTIG